MSKTVRIPKHVGIIPDGNRRYATSKGLNKEDGYKFGVEPGIKLFDILLNYGVEEITFYGFTKDNVKRPKKQREKYIESCIHAVNSISKLDAQILVVGDYKSSVFPNELLCYTEQRVVCGKGSVKVNFLINYDWNQDLSYALNSCNKNIAKNIMSNDISRVDLIIRWGGHRRLSGFLPIQSVYSDFYVIDELWPDFNEVKVYDALEWYKTLDITLGG